jgi:hypothetical protein
MNCVQVTYHQTCFHELLNLKWPWLVIAGQDVRVTTTITGALLFALVLWRTENPLRAAAATMAWLTLYEVCFLVTSTALLGSPWRDTFWQTFAILAWPLLAFALGLRPHPALLGAFGVGWLAWAATGLHANWPSGAFRLGDEIANVATKTILAGAYMAGVWRFRGEGRRSLAPMVR